MRLRGAPATWGWGENQIKTRFKPFREFQFKLRDFQRKKRKPGWIKGAKKRFTHKIRKKKRDVQRWRDERNREEMKRWRENERDNDAALYEPTNPNFFVYPNQKLDNNVHWTLLFTNLKPTRVSYPPHLALFILFSAMTTPLGLTPFKTFNPIFIHFNLICFYFFLLIIY